MSGDKTQMGSDTNNPDGGTWGGAVNSMEHSLFVDGGHSFTQLASKKSLQVLCAVTESSLVFGVFHLSSESLTFIKPQVTSA